MAAAKEKMSLEQYLAACGKGDGDFVQELHDYMLANKGKVTFEKQKTNSLGSLKYKQRSVFNFLLREHGLFVRIYGENIGTYPDFLQTLPGEMIGEIQQAGLCKWLVYGKCSPKCGGYDFHIADEHFQKCRYGCFEFLATEGSKPFIKAFVEHEMRERMNPVG